jgi:hypothetical protein
MLARHSGMTACGPKTMVAYWLIPAEAARSFSVSIIAELAARFDAPTLPHVTIYGTRMGEDMPAEVLNRALLGCPPFRLSVRNLQYSDSFTKTVFVQFEPSPPLRTAEPRPSTSVRLARPIRSQSTLESNLQKDGAYGET